MRARETWSQLCGRCYRTRAARWGLNTVTGPAARVLILQNKAHGLFFSGVKYVNCLNFILELDLPSSLLTRSRFLQSGGCKDNKKDENRCRTHIDLLRGLAVDRVGNFVLIH